MEGRKGNRTEEDEHTSHKEEEEEEYEVIYDGDRKKGKKDVRKEG